MSYGSRQRAVDSIAAEYKKKFKTSDLDKSINDLFGCDVFSPKVMEKYLSKTVFKKFMSTLEDGKALDTEIASDVACAMKTWAIENGATHYTHWFLPLTGSTAEKHDSFVDFDADKNIIMKFSGKNLIMGEPDASSFPSGGLRSTFEARGYTAWDPTSPAFLKRGRNSVTLCIPTVFCSYTGEVLDNKTPLLRSIQVIEKQVVRLIKCFEKNFSGSALVGLGAEQEYFLIDRRLYILRPDIIQCGRTLFGSPPKKHQQLDDHYFGSINPRILAFMAEVDRELWRLGIPAKTRHNEVAPAQFEIAPIFEEVNLAVDHNMMIMEVLRKVANRHELVCLLHEKPFAGVNGSGKHNNWSIDVGGRNLLNPGSDPHQNAIFLTTLCAIIMAVDRHSDLLRSATAGASNDHRLGANEAPPAIISIFLGDQLTDIIEQLEKGEAKSSKKNRTLHVGVDSLPSFPCDATDRNRTSPFAYTGGKFEFRAPGSSQSCANPNIILNTIVAEAFDEIADRLEKCDKASFNKTLQEILSGIVKEHKRIIFNGDNYKEAWKVEAKKRGLPCLSTTLEALQPLTDKKNIELFQKYKVYSPIEMESRHEVYVEEYKRKIKIEGELGLSIARTMVLPCSVDYLKKLSETLVAQKSAGLKNKELVKEARKVSDLIDSMCNKCEVLEKAIGRREDEIISALQNLRHDVDSLEEVVDDELWVLPKYRELLFIY